MADVMTSAVYPIAVMDVIVRALFDVFGVSVGDYGTRVHVNAGESEHDVQVFLDNVGSLVVDDVTITEGDPDPVVRCDDAKIISDASVGYVVMLDGELYASGVMAVAAGVAEDTLESPISGEYECWMFRTAFPFESGRGYVFVQGVI